MAEKLITPPFRGWFVHLNEPRGIKGDPTSDKKYQMLIPILEDDGFWKKAEAMVKDTAREKFGQIPRKLKSPIKEGAESEYEELDGYKFINPGNTRRPGLVDGRLEPIVDPEELYSGAWYRASLTAYAWEHPTGGKGVSFSLNNVMKVATPDGESDEPLDGRTSAEQDFAGFEEDSDSDDKSLLD